MIFTGALPEFQRRKGLTPIKSKKLLYLTIYFGTLHLVLFLNVFMAGHGIKPFIVTDTIAIYSVFIAIGYIGTRFLTDKAKFTRLEFFVLTFLLLSIFSVFFYFQPNNPASILAYVYGIHYLVLPIFLFFAVKSIEPEFQQILLRRILYLNLFFILVGFTMSFWRPDLYTNFLLEYHKARGYEDLWQLYARMQSYMGSVTIGNIAAVTIILSLVLKMRPLQKFLVFSLMLPAAFLSQQRGGYLAAIIAVSYYLFLKKDFFVRKIFLLSVVLLVGAGLFFVFGSKQNSFDLVDYTKNRFVYDFLKGDPFQERWSSYVRGLNLFREFPFGLGIGATTSAAESAGAHPSGQVVDANFMRILADLGLLGLILFLLVIVFSLRSAFLKKRQPFAYTAIILIYGLQALGTNVFDSYYLSHFFWLLLGIIDTKS